MMKHRHSIGISRVVGNYAMFRLSYQLIVTPFELI